MLMDQNYTKFQSLVKLLKLGIIRLNFEDTMAAQFGWKLGNQVNLNPGKITKAWYLQSLCCDVKNVYLRM